MKQTEKTEKKKHLTDAELRQVTGGDTTVGHWEEQGTVVGSWKECKDLSDKATCVQSPDCRWFEDKKDAHRCIERLFS